MQSFHKKHLGFLMPQNRHLRRLQIFCMSTDLELISHNGSLNRSCDMINFCFTTDFTLGSHAQPHDSHESAENHGTDGPKKSLDLRCFFLVLWYMCQLKALRGTCKAKGIQLLQRAASESIALEISGYTTADVAWTKWID